MIDIKRNHGHLSFVRRHPPISKLSSRTFLLSARFALFPSILMIITVHNVYFVKYDVTVSFLAHVLYTVTHFVPQVLDTAS